MQCTDLYSNLYFLPGEHEKSNGWPLCDVQHCKCVLRWSCLISQIGFSPLLCSVNCAVPQELEAGCSGDLEGFYRILWEGTVPTTPTHRGDNIQLLPIGHTWDTDAHPWAVWFLRLSISHFLFFGHH